MGFTMFYHVYPANSWVSPCFSRDFPRQAPQRALQHALAAAKAFEASTSPQVAQVAQAQVAVAEARNHGIPMV